MKQANILQNQDLLEYTGLITQYLTSKKLNQEQRTALVGYAEHLLKDTKDKQPRYIKTVFRILRDFGASIKKPYEGAKKADFESYYEWLSETKSSAKATVEAYERVLRRFYEWHLRELGKEEYWKKLEIEIISIFKSKVIKERLNINVKEIKRQNMLKTIRSYFNSNALLEDQKEVLESYFKYLNSGCSKSYSIHHLASTFRTLYDFSVFIKKPFNKAERQDFINYFHFLKEEKKFSPASMDGYKCIIKVFYKFLYGTEGYPDCVSWIQLERKRIRKKDNEVLTPEEIKGILKFCKTPRNRALIMVTYDGACRAGEVLNLKIKDVVVDDYGAKIQVDGKTGQRTIRLIDAVPYLTEHLNYHPLSSNNESYLFLEEKQIGKPLREHGLHLVLKKAAQLAKINKRIHPHLLRHSRLTQLAKEGFNERDLRIFAGWSNDSKMPDTYIHYGEEHVDKKLLEKKGLLKKEEEPTKEILKPKTCPRCNKVNPATALYCNCGMALDLRTVVKDLEQKKEINEQMNELFKNDEFKAIVKRFLMKR